MSHKEKRGSSNSCISFVLRTTGIREETSCLIVLIWVRNYRNSRLVIFPECLSIQFDFPRMGVRSAIPEMNCGGHGDYGVDIYGSRVG